jgi:hypothetical protein
MDKDPIAWHPAFFQAIQLELEAYLDVLEFTSEHQLTSEPLQIDAVIIKKKKEVRITNPIVGIFKGFNILEFKSRSDYLSVDDFYKGYAYMCLYKAFERVDITDISLSFVETKYPRELIKHLQTVRGYTVSEQESGIYVVTGDTIPIQFIETKKLSSKDSVYLRALNSNLDVETVNHVLEAAQKPHRADISAFVDAVLRANTDIVEEVLTMGRKTLEQVLEESGMTAKWKAEGKAEGRYEACLHFAINLIKKGWSGKDIAETTGLDLATVESLYREAHA